MRAGTRTLLLAAGLAASLSCDEERGIEPSCSEPIGCLSVRTIDGKCTCVAWEPVAVDPVPLKYVVVGVFYAAPGNASTVEYGWVDFVTPAPASDMGARWRAVVRGGGEDRVASVGPISGVTNLARVTDASATWADPPSDGALGIHSVVDVHAHDRGDVIVLWVNPAAAVVTDAGGGRSVEWSVSNACPDVVPCDPSGHHVWVTAGVLAGTVPADARLQPLLDWLGPDDRAAILAYDPFFDPANDPSTIPARARFAHAGAFGFGGIGASFPDVVRWTPCEGTLTDAAFAVLAEAPAVGFGQGDALVLQYSVLSTSAACAVQAPAMTLASTTPGCAIAGDVYVDRVFGTLVFLPSSVAPECVVQ